MTDHHHAPRDLAWYRDRWEELTDLLPTSEPEEVVDQVRELQISVLDEEAEALEEMGLTDAEEAKTVLQRTFERLQKLRRENQALERLQETVGADSPDEIAERVNQLRDRVETLEAQQEALTEAGFERPEHVLQAITSMEQQLDELYGEKAATERSTTDISLEEQGDTFDQLQALMAREEHLQRELGVSSPGAVIEMVEGMTDQLEDLYENRDATSADDPVFAPVPEQSELRKRLEEEFGVSDPDDLRTMINDLEEQLNELYADRQRLAEHNLNGADDAIKMLSSMQGQLESLYEGQKQMSEHGINGIDHALSMIESMEAQLSELYDERYELVQQGVDDPHEAASRIEELQEKLTTLKEEKSALRDKRDRLQAQFDELEAELGTDDPAAISELIDNMQAQLEETYEEREALATPSPEDAPLLPETPLSRLDDLDDEALDALPAGVFGINDEGTVRRTNANVHRWPDVDVDDSTALVGSDFFADVAPAANSDLFRGRFEDGVAEGETDERFFYTYVPEQGPPSNLVVHLYRHPDRVTNWVVFRVV
jgi:photoactive yellow protein